MIMLGFKCRKYISFLHNKPFCKVVSYLKARMYYTDCLGFSFLCFPWPRPHHPLHPFPQVPACLWERSVHCDLWPLAEADLEVFRPTFNSCPPLFLRIPFQDIFVFQTISPSPKLAARPGNVKSNTPCPSHARSGHWLTTVEMTFDLQIQHPFHVSREHQTLQGRWHGLASWKEGSIIEPTQETLILKANFPINRKSCVETIV